MKKIAIALALSLAATSAFAQKTAVARADCKNVKTTIGGATVPDKNGNCVAALAPGGTTAVAGNQVVIAGQTQTYAIVSGVLLLALLASANNNTND
jgi:hypothetical protein